jgi:hypothetical protein
VANPSMGAPQQSRGRLFLLLGLALALLGVVTYVVQTARGRLLNPWYLPVLAALGAILVVVSLVARRTACRVVALAALMLLAGAEWAVLHALRLPPYTGPITVGQPFPAFETTRADGTPFAQADLAGDRNSVVVFFRGRW